MFWRIKNSFQTKNEQKFFTQSAYLWRLSDVEKQNTKRKEQKSEMSSHFVTFVIPIQYWLKTKDLWAKRENKTLVSAQVSTVWLGIDVNHTKLRAFDPLNSEIGIQFQRSCNNSDINFSYYWNTSHGIRIVFTSFGCLTNEWNVVFLESTASNRCLTSSLCALWAICFVVICRFGRNYLN